MSWTGFLEPLRSSLLIHKLAKHVSINKNQIPTVAKQLLESMVSGHFGIGNWRQHELHPSVADDAAINWIFLVDSLNFSFWTQPGHEQFALEFKGKVYTGYWALVAAINRSLEAKVPITDPHFYSQIDESTLAELFKGINNVQMPLLSERTQILRENGQILIQEFGGHFKNVILKSENSSQKLLKLIVEHFPSFRDQCWYNGHEVSFYKRAQILVADIWACFGGEGLGHFDDINSLTMFADYRVPQVLEFFGILEYSNELKELLKKNSTLSAGSEIECEIRGQSIYAVHLLVQELENEKKNLSPNCHQEVSINSVLVDFYLWDFRRDHTAQIDDMTCPFHKTRSIYY